MLELLFPSSVSWVFFHSLHLLCVCCIIWNNPKDQICSSQSLHQPPAPTYHKYNFIFYSDFIYIYILTNHFFLWIWDLIKFLKIVNHSYLKIFFYFIIFLRANFSACWVGVSEPSHVSRNPTSFFLTSASPGVKWAMYWILASRIREKSLPGLDPKTLPRKEVKKRQYAFSAFSSLDCWQDTKNPVANSES